MGNLPYTIVYNTNILTLNQLSCFPMPMNKGCAQFNCAETQAHKSILDAEKDCSVTCQLQFKRADTQGDKSLLDTEKGCSVTIQEG